MKTDIKQTVRQCSKCLEYQCTQLDEAALHYDIPRKLWTIVGTDIFMINHKKLTFIVDYYSRFPIAKKR